MRNRFFSFLLLLLITGCARNSELLSTITETPIAPLTPLPQLPYKLFVLNPPPDEMELPELIVADDGTLNLTSGKGASSEYSKTILDTNNDCFVSKVTASYSPDYRYIAISKRCLGHEDAESVYLTHSAGGGLIRRIVGYDRYEGSTNRPIEWAPDSKSFIYYRSAAFGDAHLEVFTGIFRYDIETAERKYLARIWGQYKWSPNGKWIAILDLHNAWSDTACKTLYLLDSQGESLWELDSMCEKLAAQTEILWHSGEDASNIVVLIQKEAENQNIISKKEYEIDDLSSYKQIPIQ